MAMRMLLCVLHGLAVSLYINAVKDLRHQVLELGQMSIELINVEL